MFRGKAMTYYGRWTYKYEIATREGRGGRVHRPRDRSGRLSAAKSCRRAGRASSSTSISPDAEQARAGRRLDHARQGEGALRGGGPELRLASQARRRRRTSRPSPLEREGERHGQDRPCARIEVAERRREARGQRRRRTSTSSTPRTGITSAATPRCKGDQIFNGALDNASGVGDAARDREGVHEAADEAASARSSSCGRPRRRQGCSARSTTRRIRCIRSTRRSRTSTSTASTSGDERATSS